MPVQSPWALSYWRRLAWKLDGVWTDRSNSVYVVGSGSDQALSVYTTRRDGKVLYTLDLITATETEQGDVVVGFGTKYFLQSHDIGRGSLTWKSCYWSTSFHWTRTVSIAARWHAEAALAWDAQSGAQYPEWRIEDVAPVHNNAPRPMEAPSGAAHSWENESVHAGAALQIEEGMQQGTENAQTMDDLSSKIETGEGHAEAKQNAAPDAVQESFTAFPTNALRPMQAESDARTTLIPNTRQEMLEVVQLHNVGGCLMDSESRDRMLASSELTIPKYQPPPPPGDPPSQGCYNPHRGMLMSQPQPLPPPPPVSSTLQCLPCPLADLSDPPPPPGTPPKTSEPRGTELVWPGEFTNGPFPCKERHPIPPSTPSPTGPLSPRSSQPPPFVPPPPVCKDLGTYYMNDNEVIITVMGVYHHSLVNVVYAPAKGKKEALQLACSWVGELDFDYNARLIDPWSACSKQEAKSALPPRALRKEFLVASQSQWRMYGTCAIFGDNLKCIGASAFSNNAQNLKRAFALAGILRSVAFYDEQVHQCPKELDPVIDFVKKVAKVFTKNYLKD